MAAGLQALQTEAYTAVCRAFYAQESLKWEQEDVLTKLRDFWNISNQMHSTITSEMRNDPDVVAVRGGGMPSRVGRGGGKNAMLAPAPSLGAAGGHQTPPSSVKKRRQALPAVSEHSSPDSEGGSAYSDHSELSSRAQRNRSKRSSCKAGGGGGSRSGGSKARHGSLAQQASLRRPAGMGSGMGAALGLGGGGGGVGGVGGAMQRSRSTRQNNGFGGAVDPLGFVGRRLWRFWPTETPPWVEGFIQQWNPEDDGYVIVYDPNTRESTEEVFHFGTAVEGVDYSVGEYVDMTQMHGSRRQAERPYVSPEVLAQGPPPGLLAALAPAPSKKRRSVSGAPVPADAPFEPTYLHARLPIAAEDELHQMLAVLERKERIVEAEINILDYQEANREDIEERSALERRFHELCEREMVLMAEIATLREVVAA